ncbi:MAG: type II secretion system protein [Kiritimatiellae bacterium]|nr:type II secretion system protein [Kiritimatiellia bacterium]MCO5069241.1 type II secretion system GspH family protein [Kiritimatiellia bacterium]
MKKAEKRGFTLIELLVVIAIIVLLASILYPTVGRALERGRRAKCASNLQQLGLIFLNFAQDNQGYLPWGRVSVPDDLKDGRLNEQGNMRAVTTNLYGRGYIKDFTLLVCPSDKVDGDGNNTPVSIAKEISRFNPVGNCSYLYIIGHNVLTSPERHSVAPVLADEANKQENGSLQAGNMPKITELDNHGANFRVVLYLDGHVQPIDSADASNAIFDYLVNPTILMSVD